MLQKENYVSTLIHPDLTVTGGGRVWGCLCIAIKRWGHFPYGENAAFQNSRIVSRDTALFSLSWFNQ